MLTLYGSEFSLYTGKARSYLRKQGWAFREVKSTIAVNKKVIIPNTGVQFIPVVKTETNRYLQDTSVIIDFLEQRTDRPSVFPATPKQGVVSRLLEVYGDEWLLMPAMHYRWNFPEKNARFIHAEFGSVVLPSAPAFLQRFVGKRLGAKFRGFVPILGINETTIPAIEASYEALLDDLNNHFLRYPFLLGNRPSIGDFGLIGPLYAHLYRDPAPGELMRSRAPEVAAWVQRMISAEPANGDVLPNDEVPETLFPILRRMAQEQLPVILNTQVKLDNWAGMQAQASAQVEVPRRLGQHSFFINDVESERAVLPHALWKWQRPLDFYLALDNRTELDHWLQSCGFTTPLPVPKTRLIRKNNRVVVDS